MTHDEFCRKHAIRGCPSCTDPSADVADLHRRLARALRAMKAEGAERAYGKPTAIPTKYWEPVALIDERAELVARRRGRSE